jgi:hypothetical protein
VQAVKRAELAEFGADAAAVVATAKSSPQESYQEQIKRQEAEAETRTVFNKRLLATVRAAAAKEPRSTVDLQLVARAMLDYMGYDYRDLIKELHGNETGLSERLQTMGPDDLALLLLDFALIQGVEVDRWNLDKQPEILLAAAAHYGVQVGQGTVVAGQDPAAEEGEPA